MSKQSARPLIAAELELEIRHADGTTEPLTVRLMVPVPSPKMTGAWRCDVQFAGYRNVVRTIYGVDSWQAIGLARKLVAAELEALLPRLLCWGEPADPRLLFD